MRILIITPLFPPDTAPSAGYVKELVARLQPHEVTVLLYGELPEQIPNVRLIAITKQTSSWRRFYTLTRAAFTLAKDHDLILLQNGPSAEPTGLLLSYLRNIPIIFMMSDAPAADRSLSQQFSRFIFKQLETRAKHTFATTYSHWPPAKPIIHPLLPYPTAAYAAYDTAWKKHCSDLDSITTLLS